MRELRIDRQLMDAKGHAKLKVLIFVFIAWLHTWSGVTQSQTPRFISFIADTHIGYCITASPDGKNVYAGGAFTLAAFARSDSDTLRLLQIFNNDHRDADGIHHIIDLVVTPDGRFLYAVEINNQSLLLFARDTNTGKLNLLESFSDGAFASLYVGIPFEEGNYKLLLSPDATHLYWLYSPRWNYSDNRIVVFARNSQTGWIEKTQTLRDDDSGFHQYKIPSSLALSPDGKNFYGGGYNGNNLLMFSREKETGKITFQKAYEAISSPNNGWYESGTVVTPDGAAVYTASFYSNVLTGFKRHLENGELTLIENRGLHGIVKILVSPDGSHLYAGSGYLTTFERSRQSGTLISVDTTIVDAKAPAGIAISPDGRNIYGTSISGLTIVQRDTVTGRLSISKRLNRNLGGTDRLHGARAVAISPEGKFLYVAANDGREDIGISVFSRDQANGQITLSESYPLDYFGTIVLPADGRHLYVTKAENLPLEVFARDEQSGSLRRQEPQGDSSGASFVHPALFSANGKHLYVNSLWDMTVFQREPMNGQLTRVQRINCQDYDLGEVFGLAISPDDSFLYRYSFDLPIEGFQIATFARDPASGQLRFLHKIENGYLPGFYLGPVPPPASTIIISPDGRHVYVAATEPHINAYYDATLCAYSRNPATGELTFVQALRFGEWWEMRDLGISLDGSAVYALMSSGGSSSELAILDRDTDSGRLTVNKRFESWKEGVYGMFSSWDLTLSPDGRFIYIADTGGLATFATGRNTTSITEKLDNHVTVPQTLQLEQNYPNPFSSLTTSATLGAATTTIRYEILVASKQAVPVELAIYNLHGRLVRTLVNELKIGGRYSAVWNAFDAHGKPVPSGLYFYRLKSGDSIITRRLLLIK